MNDLDRYLHAIANGDERAFAHWLAAAERPLRVAMRSFAAQVDTEAVLQEGMLRVWQVAPRFQPDGSANGLLRLAHRIVRNLCISELRRRQSSQSATAQRLLDATTPNLDQPAACDPLLRDAIETCREQLPKKPAAALAARIAARGGEPDRVTAANLNMRKNTFLQNVTRARRLLRDCLERRGVQLSRGAS